MAVGEEFSGLPALEIFRAVPLHEVGGGALANARHPLEHLLGPTAAVGCRSSCSVSARDLATSRPLIAVGWV